MLQAVTCEDNTPMNDLWERDLCLGIGPVLYTAGGVMLVFITVTTVLYYKNKTRILIYCYSSQWRFLRWFVSHPDDIDTDKWYDAFISFANEDIQFVADILVPHLEDNGERKYTLCLHYRDWVVGEYILTQITRSVKRSRRTIIVMSPDFLQSVWGQAEFRTAYTEGMQEGRLRLIVIMYKDIGNADGLDEDLKVFLKTTTYLEWNDTPTFWRRLFFALPHPPGNSETVKASCNCFRSNNSHSVRQENVMELQPEQEH